MWLEERCGWKKRFGKMTQSEQVLLQPDEVPLQPELRPNCNQVILRTVCVGRGDAIFIAITYDNGKSNAWLQDCSIIIIITLIINTVDDRHCYLVDGSIGTGGRKSTCQHTITDDFSKLIAAYERYIEDGYTLEGIIVTHPDIDHYKGILYLLEEYKKEIECPLLLTNQFLTESEKAKSKSAVSRFLNTLEKTHHGFHTHSNSAVISLFPLFGSNFF